MSEQGISLIRLTAIRRLPLWTATTPQPTCTRAFFKAGFITRSKANRHLRVRKRSLEARLIRSDAPETRRASPNLITSAVMRPTTGGTRKMPSRCWNSRAMKPPRFPAFNLRYARSHS